MKFGGTSVGSPARMKEVTKLVTKSGEPVFVVLSAMSGTTNSLVDISNYLYKKNADGANDVINQLEQKYLKHVDELYQTDAMKEKTNEFIKSEGEPALRAEGYGLERQERDQRAHRRRSQRREYAGHG